MAKVYDALKQVEAERSRQLRAVTATAPAVQAGESTFWRRWSGRRGGDRNEYVQDDRHAASEAAVPADPSLWQKVDAILSRLDAFEHLTKQRLPELERNLLQVLEARIDAVEREVASSISTLGRQMRHEVAALNKRISVLLGAVAVLAVALLLKL